MFATSIYEALPGVEFKIEVDRAQAAIYGADVSQVGVAVHY